ncbi:MAG: hypothetical protein K6G65_08370 [Lachnospiraceae bacterium]|nr:hypothetical protein [Lachnospiraceae bacterium]
MLGKLIKYEINATYRWFFSLYLACILFTPLAYFGLADFTGTALESFPGYAVIIILQAIISLFTILIFAGVNIVGFALSIYRYYKNLMCEEGYLMHTLPASPLSLITAKAVTSLMWAAGSLLVSLVCVRIATGTDTTVGEILNNFLHAIYPNPDWSAALDDSKTAVLLNPLLIALIIECILFLVCFYLTQLLICYAAMALANIINTSHKVFLSVVFYFTISLTLQRILIPTVSMFFTSNGSGFTSYSVGISYAVYDYAAVNSMRELVLSILPIVISIYLVTTIALLASIAGIVKNNSRVD